MQRYGWITDWKDDTIQLYWVIKNWNKEKTACHVYDPQEINCSTPAQQLYRLLRFTELVQ